MPHQALLASDPDARLRRVLDQAAGFWLVVLPLLRPLVWSGEPTSLGNLFYLVLLTAAIANGALLAGFRGGWRPGGVTTALGVVFLAGAALGCWFSPVPARAWTLWVGWLLHLAAPVALWPVIRARPGLVVVGLLTGLVAEGALLAGQVLWERPELQQRFAADPALAGQKRMADQFQVRISSWRLEGSFLLANTLAAYLITAWPLVAALAWRAWRRTHPSRWLLVAILSLATVALAMTGSKAGILSLMVAGAITLALGVSRWRWRALVLAGLGLVAALALISPDIRTRLAASAGVRVDYWRAAVTLVAERPWTGYGLEGFSVQYPRVKPPAAEETVIAHQEALQAAADLGLPVALILVAWWVAVLIRLRPRSTDAADLESTAPVATATGDLAGRWWPVAVGALLLFAMLFVGVLRGSFEVYPGGWDGWWWVWSVGLTALSAALVVSLRQVPSPPPAACFCGVLACLLHAQADFPLHSPQVVGILALVAVLGLALRAGVSSPAVDVPASVRRQWCGAVFALIVLAAVMVGVMVAAARDDVMQRSHRLKEVLMRLALKQGGEPEAIAWEELDEMLLRSGLPPASAGSGESVAPLVRLTLEELARAGDRFPADSDLAFREVEIATWYQVWRPARTAEMTPFLEELVQRWPGHLLGVKALADHYCRLALQSRERGEQRAGELARQAQRWAQAAVDLYPTQLTYREELIAVAGLTGDAATVARETAAIRDLQDRVHRDNRPRRRW